MSGRWSDSGRRSRLPRDWERRRRVVKRRSGNTCESHATGLQTDCQWVDGTCRTHDLERCTAPSRDVHHAGGPEQHDPAFLLDLCVEHHRHETQREAAAGHAAARAQVRRPPERHPIEVI